jgi:hypothetical protein
MNCAKALPVVRASRAAGHKRVVVAALSSSPERASGVDVPELAEGRRLPSPPPDVFLERE